MKQSTNKYTYYVFYAVILFYQVRKFHFWVQNFDAIEFGNKSYLIKFSLKV